MQILTAWKDTDANNCWRYCFRGSIFLLRNTVSTIRHRWFIADARRSYSHAMYVCGQNNTLGRERAAGRVWDLLDYVAPSTPKRHDTSTRERMDERVDTKTQTRFPTRRLGAVIRWRLHRLYTWRLRVRSRSVIVASNTICHCTSRRRPQNRCRVGYGTSATELFALRPKRRRIWVPAVT